MSHANLTDLFHRTCESLIFAPADKVQVASLNVVMFDRVVGARSMEYELDISRELWITKGRFTVLQRDYIDPDELERFVMMTGRITNRPSIAQMLCRVKRQRHVSFRWGNCILGFTFRAAPKPVMTMHSRISAITRMGGLDLALAYCTAQLIAAERNEAVEDYGFVWHATSLAHSAMVGMPYVLAHGLHEHPLMRTDSDRPGAALFARTCEYYDKVERENRPVKLGTRKRIMMQRREFLDGKMKRRPVPLSQLNFDNLRRKDA